MTDATIEAEIKAKGLTAPRVTPEAIQHLIASVHYFTAADGVKGSPDDCSMAASDALGVLTFCVLILKNGFMVTGESACASPENFDAAVGQKIARQNAEQKIWALEGYRLKQALYDIKELPHD
jgi:hypothetical protein